MPTEHSCGSLEHGRLLKGRMDAILQNGGIKSSFYACVGHGYMPLMDLETIGGIFMGTSLRSGRVCVPPYSQNVVFAIS